MLNREVKSTRAPTSLLLRYRETIYLSIWFVLAYKNGPMSTSLTFLDGKRGFANAKLSTQAYSLGADYEVIPGFKPFAEVTLVKYNPTGAQATNLLNGGNSAKATVFILGTRVKF